MAFRNFSRWICCTAALSLVFTVACNNGDAVQEEKIFAQVYSDYHLNADEDGGFVNCLLQFRQGGANGKAISIDPATVALDGEPFQSDSALRTGFYYELQKNLDSFAGEHKIVFTMPGGKTYIHQFEFYPFTLQDSLPAKITRKPLTLHLKNFPAGERSVRLLLLDTAFESNGFNEMVPVVNGKVKIGEDILSTLKNGPINLELYLEKTSRLNDAAPAGGRFSINYGLRREFDLVD